VTSKRRSRGLDDEGNVAICKGHQEGNAERNQHPTEPGTLLRAAAPLAWRFSDCDGDHRRLGHGRERTEMAEGMTVTVYPRFAG
jgi:hypothetical protein